MIYLVLALMTVSTTVYGMTGEEEASIEYYNPKMEQVEIEEMVRQRVETSNYPWPTPSPTPVTKILDKEPNCIYDLVRDGPNNWRLTRTCSQ